MLVLIVILILISGISCTQKSVVFCDDAYGKYSAILGNIVLTNVEFPIMSTIPPGSTGVSDLSVPKLLHPCYSLSTRNNYKNQLFDIFSYGNFATTICERQCAHFVDALRFTCGERRPPPTWQLGSVGGVDRKINCSNWDLPLTEKGKKDGISLIYTYGTFTSGSGIDFTPPYTMDNKSIDYLDTMFIKGFQIKPIVNPTLKSLALTDMENILELFVTRHPEMTHVAFGNPIFFFGDVIRKDPKYFAPRFEPTDKFYSTLAKIPSLNSLSLSMINITGKETIPYEMTKNLKSIGFYNVTMASIPKWVASSIMEFVEFQSSLTDKTDVSVLDELPALEHFLLTESMITNIKSPFLAKSVNLISLTLQCNAITSIAEGAFDHLTQLKFLSLAGNRLVSLPDNLLVNLNNLLTLDLKSIDNGTLIQTFNEVSMQCQTTLKPSGVFNLKTMPKVSKPENILALEIRGQPNFLKQNPKLLADFKNLEILNIGNLGLSSIQNLSLESLCNLNDLNLVGNPLNSKEWLGNDIFVNLNLERLRIGLPKTMIDVPDSLIAFMRTSSQIMYSTPISLSSLDLYRFKMDCSYDTISSATLYGYQIQNKTCESHVENSIQSIRAMEMLKMETTCK